jgi:hypothetical protein
MMQQNFVSPMKAHKQKESKAQRDESPYHGKKKADVRIFHIRNETTVRTSSTIKGTFLIIITNFKTCTSKPQFNQLDL